MRDVSRPRLLLLTVAGWVHREQAATIAYLIEETRVLKKQLRGRRLRLTNPDSAFRAQVARDLTDTVDGFLLGKRALILDRDAKFTDQFERILEDAGTAVVTTSYQAPNTNAISARFVLSIKSECLSELILFGSRHLERAAREFACHDHEERPHQALGNELIAGRPDAGSGDVVVHERLGGLLKHDHRAA